MNKLNPWHGRFQPLETIIVWGGIVDGSDYQYRRMAVQVANQLGSSPGIPNAGVWLTAVGNWILVILSVLGDLFVD